MSNTYIPAAWKREELDADLALYTEPTIGGMVTVDYGRRQFRIGFVRQGRADSTKLYIGRGWRRALELDACMQLHAAVGVPASTRSAKT